MDFVAAALLGSIFGLSELVARYRDEPAAALRTFPAIIYLAFNAIISPATLLIVHVFDWTFGIQGPDNESKIRVVQVVVASFSAMAILRSSLLNIRIGNQDVGIGFSAAVQSFLRAVDYAVDRKRGTSRDEFVKIMDEVAFDRAVAVLPAYCLSLMQNLSSDDQSRLAREIESITKVKAQSAIKSRMLGLAMINIMGTKILSAAVNSLGDTIRIPPL